MEKGSFIPTYFSIDDIIASQIRVPCKTQRDLPYFGFLEPSLNSDHLPSGVELELPLWAAQVMSKPSRKYVTTTLPLKYKEAYRSVLKADATVVDLNKLGPQFYQSGLHLSSLPNPENSDLIQVVPEVLGRRLQCMTDSISVLKVLHSADEATAARKGIMMKESRMDALEYSIYKAAKKGSNTMLAYLEGHYNDRVNH